MKKSKMRASDKLSEWVNKKYPLSKRNTLKWTHKTICRFAEYYADQLAEDFLTRLDIFYGDDAQQLLKTYRRGKLRKH